jgi:methylenetetrahydrofolate reductase (NADPH)
MIPTTTDSRPSDSLARETRTSVLTKIRNLLTTGRCDAPERTAVAVTADEHATAPRASDAAMSRLVGNLHYEIVPMKSIDQAMADLPPHAHVSVTCSPVKGIPATLEYTAELLRLGHQPVPHIAARLVTGADEAAALAEWVRTHDLAEVFVIAGDASEPAGEYDGALPFLRDFLAADPGVARIGIAGYPDGHASIDGSEITRHLHAKQTVLDDAGVGGWISTQMCFDEGTIRSWIERERSAGIHLPIRLGLPGVVDRTRLMTMGTRLGIGASMRYLAKNRSTVMHLMSPGGFDPTDMVVAFAADAEQLGIEALHAFTFNAVADTRAWQEAIMTGGDR